MIRRLLAVMIFSTTVMLAAFGQHIFGREDIVRLVADIREDGPRHIGRAIEKTDAALAQLVTEAGTEPAGDMCSYADFHWAVRMYSKPL
jgi:hypothetical protein